MLWNDDGSPLDFRQKCTVCLQYLSVSTTKACDLFTVFYSHGESVSLTLTSTVRSVSAVCRGTSLLPPLALALGSSLFGLLVFA